MPTRYQKLIIHQLTGSFRSATRVVEVGLRQLAVDDEAAGRVVRERIGPRNLNFFRCERCPFEQEQHADVLPQNQNVAGWFGDAGRFERAPA